MATKSVVRRATEDRRQGKAASTQAGEFVREEMHHVREGKHGARSAKQAIAIGLSKARRAGVPLKPPAAGKASEKTRRSAERAYEKGRSGQQATSRTRSRATSGALKREGHAAASERALARQAKSAARRRTPEERSAAARKAAQTKGPEQRSAAARKAAHTKGAAGRSAAARKAARTRAEHQSGS
jgi:hypothetical protein